ncbi:MAG: glycosyltransferase [Bacteroidales bacterium]|nr:glycosyltransferase [Bacteroidales bacterium]
MKILNVTHYFLPKNSAGTEVVTYNLSKEFKKRNHQVAVFHGEKPQYQKNLSVESGFYEDLQIFKIYNDFSHIKQYFDLYKNKKIDKHFGSFLDRNKPEVVHFHHLIGLSFGMIDECKIRNIPIYFTAHDFWCQCPQGQRFHQLKNEICYEIDTNECAVCQGFSSLSIFFEKVRKKIDYIFKKYHQELQVDNEVISLIKNKDKCRINARKKNIDFNIKQQPPYLMVHPNARLKFSKILLTPKSKIKFSLSCLPEKKQLIKGKVKIIIKFGKQELFSQIFDASQLKEKQDFCLTVQTTSKDKLRLEMISIEPCFNFNLAFYDLQIENPRISNTSNDHVNDFNDAVYYQIKKNGKSFIAWLKRKRRKKNSQQIKKRNEYIIQQLKKCEKIICPTPILYDEFKKTGLQNLILSEDGIEKKLFENFSKVNKDDDKIIKFAYIGTFISTKGLHVLIKAFNKIEKNNAYLDIYGPKDKLTDYTVNIINSIENKNINLKGTFDKNDIANIYQTFDVLIVPSIWFENAPLVIRNAILAKTPMIVSNLGGMNFLCKNNINGLVFEPGNANDLKEKIDKFIENPSLISKFSSQMPSIKSIEENASELLGYYDKHIKNIEKNVFSAGQNDNSSIKVSIVIPTYNGDEYIEQVFAMIKKQKVGFGYEVIIVDSGSTDRTLTLVKNYGWQLYEIDKNDFNHGLTRNYAISKTRGEFIVLLTQDAIPENEDWLSNIIKNFEDPMVCGVYARQIPRKNCNKVLANSIINSLAGSTQKVVNQLTSFENYYTLEPSAKYKLTNFDNVCSCLRRSFWQKNPFVKSNFGEDIRMGIDIILSGKKIVFEPSASVVHSHNRNLRYEYKRSYSANIKLLENFNLVSIASFKDYFKTVVKNIKKDIILCKEKNFSFNKKRKYIFYSILWNLLTRFGAYRANIDWQKGKINNYFI